MLTRASVSSLGLLIVFLVPLEASVQSSMKWAELQRGLEQLKYLYDPYSGGLKKLQKGLRFSEAEPTGGYHFAFDSGPGPLKDWHFREEFRSASSGVVRGRFGFAASKRAFRVTEYIANAFGYRAFSKTIPMEDTTTTTTAATRTTTAPPRARGRNMLLYRLYD